MPIAAGLAALLLFVGIDYLADDGEGSAGMISLGKIEDPAMRAALDRIPTGRGETLHGGAFRAIASFIAGDGAFCRQFSVAARTGTSQAVGCRNGKDWTVGFALLEPGEGVEYTPADGNDAVGAYLSSLGATRPLTEAVEKDLLEGSR